MTDTPNEPEADERRVAHILRRHGVGPDAHPGPVRLLTPTRPEPGPDWLDRLWDAMAADEQQTATPPTTGGGRLPDWRAAKTPLTTQTPDTEAEAKDDLVPLVDTGRTPAPMPDSHPALVDAPASAPDAPAYDPSTPGTWWTAHPDYWPHPHWPTVPQPVQRVALAPRTRAFLYNASAAGTGYALGLAPHLSTWLHECGSQAGIPAALVLGIGGCIALAHIWDRRTRHWWPGLAWAARIPLASALLALGLYAPGVH